jgi:hypothetical protein
VKLRRTAALFATITALCFSADKQTALDRYVATPDSAYRYQLLSTVKGDGFTMHVLEMTSQTWRSSAEVDRTGSRLCGRIA